MRAIGGMQSSMRVTTVIMRYCDQPALRVGIRLVIQFLLVKVQVSCFPQGLDTRRQDKLVLGGSSGQMEGNLSVICHLNCIQICS